MKVLIIEDEINAFEYLRTIIRKLRPGTEVLAHLESVEEAINWLHERPHPDLIFLDIQLSDGLSFEIFKHVEVCCPIIFTTAFDQYAVQAFKVNSIDYLLKPIHIDELERAWQKFERQAMPATPDLSRQLQSIFQQLSPQKKHRCLVKKGNHFEFINISDIALVQSEDGITFLHTFQGKRHLYANTVEGLVSTLEPRQFFQINRSQVVNIDAVQKVHPYFNQRLKVELNLPGLDPELIVSRANVQDFKSWLDA